MGNEHFSGGIMSFVYGTVSILGGTMSNGKHVYVLSRKSQILFTRLKGLLLSFRSWPKVFKMLGCGDIEL